MLLKVVDYPDDQLTISNYALLSVDDMPGLTQIKITVNGGQSYLLSVAYAVSLNSKEIGLCVPHLTWMNLDLCAEVDVTASRWIRNKYLASITIEIGDKSPKTYDADEMAKVLIKKYSCLMFSKQQLFPFNFKDKTFVATVLDLMEVDEKDVHLGRPNPKRVQFGILHYNTKVKISSRTCSLTGECVVHPQSVIVPDFDFNKLEIGGLDKELGEMFRRAFNSRMFPSDIVKQCGGKLVKGILLYGPPGTGKTLIARKISGMLTSHPPKVVNGPEVLNKFVGESEANVRRLFAEAEEEEKRLGPASALHIIIFDEIDAICKQRSNEGSSTRVHDTVVNQLLSKMDGVEQLNNILIIGMTNRLDLIDKALLRPGRFEVKVDIGLPDEQGRLQILKIHTAKMAENDRLDTDVDLEELAKRTKNFTGAELEALTRAALSIAMSRAIKVGSKPEIDEGTAKNLKISQHDFLLALENDVRPAFGTNSEFSDNYDKKPSHNNVNLLEKKFENMGYEIERLRQALLAISSVNAKKWEQELTTVKNHNARLTSALQENTRLKKAQSGLPLLIIFLLFVFFSSFLLLSKYFT